MSHSDGTLTSLKKVYSKKRFTVKQWDYHDTTNKVNRNQYVEAHLDALKNDRPVVSVDEPVFEDDRPLRLSLPKGVTRGPVADAAARDHWRAWDIAANTVLAKATLRATHPKVRGGGEHDGEEGDELSTGVVSGGVLPAHIHRSALKMQIPLQHRIVNEFHDMVREGAWARMRGDGRKLPLRLLNSYVRPVCASVDQQAKLLAYYLYDLREGLTVAQRVGTYQMLGDQFEGTSPDHLAVLLSGLKLFNRADKPIVLGCIRDEVRFAGSLPYSLGAAFAMSAPMKDGAHNESIKVFTSTPRPPLLTDGAWALMARTAFAETGAVATARAVVDAATSCDTRHLKNIDLWNAYLAASDAAHAAEMLAVNMPSYGVSPNMISYAELSHKCSGGQHWELALDVAKRAIAARPSPNDPQRFQKAFREVLIDTLRCFKASGRTEEIALIKKLVPNLRAILRI